MPTTCSRPIIEMLGFMYLCIYLIIFFFLDGVLATPFDILCSNFVCRFIRTVQRAPQYTIFDLTNSRHLRKDMLKKIPHRLAVQESFYLLPVPH